MEMEKVNVGEGQMQNGHVNTRTAARVTVAVEFADAAVVAGASN